MKVGIRLDLSHIRIETSHDATPCTCCTVNYGYVCVCVCVCDVVSNGC
jgi:hypothetical protein